MAVDPNFLLPPAGVDAGFGPDPRLSGLPQPVLPMSGVPVAGGLMGGPAGTPASDAAARLAAARGLLGSVGPVGSPYRVPAGVGGALRARLESLLKRGVQARAGGGNSYRIVGPRPAALAGNAQRDAMIAGWSGRVPQAGGGFAYPAGAAPVAPPPAAAPAGGVPAGGWATYPQGPNPAVTAAQMQQLGLGSPTGQTKPPYYPKPPFAPNAVWNGYAWVDPIGGGVYPPGASR